MATDTPPDPLQLSTSQASPGAESLSPLEQEVLDEYARLLDNMDNVCCPLPCALFLPLFPSPFFLFVLGCPWRQRAGANAW